MSVNESFSQAAELFDATVAEEGPPAADILATLHVDIDQEEGGFGACFGQELALRSSHEGMTPELDAVGLVRWVFLPAGAVDSNDREAVGDGMTSLNGLPSTELALLLFVGVTALPTDGGGVDEKFGTLQRHETGSFGVPLVPTNLYAEATDRGLDRVEAQVAWREVELLVVGRVIGDVHLAIGASDASILLEHHRSVVVKASCTTVKETGDQYDAAFAGDVAIELGAGAWNRLGQIEVVGIFDLTEVERVVQLLQHDQFCTLLCCVADVCRQVFFILFYISRFGLLDERYFHILQVNDE